MILITNNTLEFKRQQNRNKINVKCLYIKDYDQDLRLLSRINISRVSDIFTHHGEHTRHSIRPVVIFRVVCDGV